MRKQEWQGYERSILRIVAGVLLPSMAHKSCSSGLVEWAGISAYRFRALDRRVSGKSPFVGSSVRITRHSDKSRVKREHRQPFSAPRCHVDRMSLRNPAGLSNKSSVVGCLFHVINDQHVNHRLLGLKFEAELLLNRDRQRGSRVGIVNDGSAGFPASRSQGRNA